MERLKEVIELIEITGDKCVILHQERGAYVVMKMADYRKLVEEQFKLSKNNSQPAKLGIPDTDIRLYEIPLLAKNSDLSDDQYYPEPLG